MNLILCMHSGAISIALQEGALRRGYSCMLRSPLTWSHDPTETCDAVLLDATTPDPATDAMQADLLARGVPVIRVTQLRATIEQDADTTPPLTDRFLFYAPLDVAGNGPGVTLDAAKIESGSAFDDLRVLLSGARTTPRARRPSRSSADDSDPGASE